MKWDILVLTQPSRRQFMEQLYGEMLLQAHPDFNIKPGFFDTSKTLGENRNILRAQSKAEYISFFDDDDWPAPDFIAKILPLLDGVDYIGFQVQCYCQHMNWIRYGETYHSLEYGSRPDPWAREGKKFFRDLVHINPIRRELAIQADFDGNFGEDCRWATKLRKLGIVKTQHYIPEVMYHYLWRAVKNDETDATDPVRMALLDSIRNRREKYWAGGRIKV